MRRAAIIGLLVLFVGGCVPQHTVAPVTTVALEEAPISAEQVRAGEALFPVQIGDAWGYIDLSGEVAIAPLFEAAGTFREGLARVRADNRWGYIRPDGSFAIPPRFLSAYDFSHGRARVVPEGAPVVIGTAQAVDEDRRFQTFITTSGAAIGQPELLEARDFSEAGGRVLAPTVRAVERRLLPLGAEFLAFLAPTIQTREAWVIIDDAGEPIALVRNAQRVLGYSGGLAAFQTRRGVLRQEIRWGYLGPGGEVAIEPRFEHAASFSEGVAAVALRGRYGYIDTAGEVVIEPRFEAVGPFSEGRARVRLDGQWGFIDPAGEVVIEPAFDVAGDFSDGLALVGRGDRFGFVAPDGSLSIPLDHSYARPFRNGLAVAHRDRQRGYIDATGSFVWSTSIIPSPNSP